MDKIKHLEAEISKIKERNRRVEADKAWETSSERKVLVFILTYLVIVSFFLFADLPNPYISSIVPAVAFILSTMSLSIFKDLWIKHVYRK